jgi:hypothetical protein
MAQQYPLYRVTFIQRDGTLGKPTLFHTVDSANDYADIVMGTVTRVDEPHQSTDAEIVACDNKVIRDSYNSAR